MSVPATDDVLRVLVTTPVAYACVVMALRVAGPRALAKLNAFDLVVTVALGSILASTITSSGPGLVLGLASLGMLLVLQVVLSWWTSRHPQRDGAVRAEPVLLLKDGALDAGGMHRARLTPQEVRQAVRAAGYGGLGSVALVCLETDGTISVIGRESVGDGSALVDLGIEL